MTTVKKLGEQCFYDLTCLHNDENSVCMQINHNAICDCKEGYHIVTHLKPTKRTFCTQGKHNRPNNLSIYEYEIISDIILHEPK